MLSQPGDADFARKFQPALLIVCYTVVVLACLTIRPLWLDEVLQLIGTTSPSIGSTIRWAQRNPGGVPLGYLTQRLFVFIGGPDAFWSRLPSALFSAASCCLLIALCRALRISRSAALIAAGVFMIVPAQFHYATEARPYSEALCFSILSMLAAASCMSRPNAITISVCLAAMVASVYTQPYALLPVLGQCVWYAWQGLKERQSRRAVLPLASLCMAVVLFIPWYRLGTRWWDAVIRNNEYPQFHWTFTLLLDAFKGISGGSFVCSLALLTLCMAGVRSSTGAARWAPLLGALFTIVGVLAIDASRNYFFASRQFLFAVPGLSILAALGLANALPRRKIVGTLFAGVFIVAAGINDVKMQMGAKEDWVAAAHSLDQLARAGYCIDMAGADQGPLTLYSVFVPALPDSLCRGRPGSKVALVSNPTIRTADISASEAELRNSGFALQQRIAVGGTTIQLEKR